MSPGSFFRACLSSFGKTGRCPCWRPLWRDRRRSIPDWVGASIIGARRSEGPIQT